MDPIKQLAAHEFSKVFISCILRYAKGYGGDHTNVFIMLGLDENYKVTYKTLVPVPGEIDYKPFVPVPEGHKLAVKENITILNVLNARLFHVKAYDIIGPPYIQSALARLAEENNLGADEVSVFICTNTVDVYLILCKVEGNEIKQMIRLLENIEELF